MSSSLPPEVLKLGEDASGFDGFNDSHGLDDLHGFDDFKDFNDSHGLDGFGGFGAFGAFGGFGGFNRLPRSGGRRPVWCPSHDLAFRSISIGLSSIYPKSIYSLGIDEGKRQ
jgi:hypothetical protein